VETVLLKCHIGFRGEAHSSSCRQTEGQKGPCCCKRDDDVDLRRLRQTMCLAHWSVCPSQVAPMTCGSVDLDDSVHRVCESLICALLTCRYQIGVIVTVQTEVTSSPVDYDVHQIHDGNEFSLDFRPSSYVVRISRLMLEICCPTGTHARTHARAEISHLLSSYKAASHACNTHTTV